MSLNDHVSQLVVELQSAEYVRIRERAQHVLFPRSVLDDDSAARLDALAGLCAAPDPQTSDSALRIAAEVIRLVAIEAVAVDEPDGVRYQEWVDRLRRVVMLHLAGRGPEHDDAGVLALYWVGVPDGAADHADAVQRGLDSYLQIQASQPLRLAAAVGLARLSAGTTLADSAAEIFGDWLAGPSLPGDEVSVMLGDARSAVRTAMDGLPQQFAIFVNACESGNAVARFQNVGQCVRLMETWRDAPAFVLPPVAAHLRDAAAPVRAAAVGAVYRSGREAHGHLDEVARLLRDPVAGVVGNPPPRLVEMLRVEALATLVAFERADAVDDLRSYLEKPYGNVPIAELVAGARYCVAEVAAQVVPWLRTGLNPSESVETSRSLAGVLDGLAAWGSRAEPLIPELAALLRAGIAESAVIEVFVGLGAGVAAVEDLLLAQLRADGATPARRAAAASALIRGELDSADEAAGVLVSMMDRPDLAPASVIRLAELDRSPELLGRNVPVGVVERLMTESASPAVRASAARVRWNAGERLPALAEALMRERGLCSAGIRCVEWLGDMGELASPYFSVLSGIREARRRSWCEHIGVRLVAADEAYQAAIAQALSAIPRTSA